MIRTLARALALALFLALASPAAALSASGPTTVALAGVVEIAMPYLVQAVGILIGLALTWLAELVRRKLGLAIDAAHRDALQVALTNGAALLIARGGSVVAGRVVDVRSPYLVEAIGYVERAAPDALRHFKLDADSLGEKLMAKLPQLAAPPRRP